MIKPSTIINNLEDDAGILNFRISTGELIWPLIRHGVITNILNYNNKLDIAQSSGTVVNKIAFLKTLLVAVAKSPFLIKKGRILFFNSGITNIKIEDSGSYFNRVTDPFYFQFRKGDAIMIESTAFKILRLPRVHSGVYPLLTLSLMARLKRKSVRLNEEEIASVENILNYIEDKLSGASIEYNRSGISTIIVDKLLNFMSEREVFHNFLLSKKPKIIFLEDASYGNNAPILLAAKNNGIKVIELQHGFVNNEHIAYNLGKGISKHKEIGCYFPDYYFAYGKFWCDSINIPSKKISIGNPFLTESVGKFEARNQKSNEIKTILFLSSGVTVNETNDFLRVLVPQAIAKGFQIVFRPHPSELNSIPGRYKTSLDLGIKVTTNSALYSDIASANIVIGELSTALFEALAFNNTRCYLLWSSFTKSYLEHSMNIDIVDNNSVQKIFEDRGEQAENKENLYFWEANWETRFQEAMSSLIDTTTASA